VSEQAPFARVLRLPEFPGDFVIFTVRNLPAAAHDALAAFGLRVTEAPLASSSSATGNETVVIGPKFGIALAAERENPARGTARALLAALAHAERPSCTIAGRVPLCIDRPSVMAAVNCTPDSFSDGGSFATPDAAAESAVAAWRAGARVIDIGGESTRPGAESVSAAEEASRVVPVLRAILARVPQCYISVDTTKADVAKAAVEAGASMINDISGLQYDPALGEETARLGVPIVLGHVRGTPANMDSRARYDHVIDEVCSELLTAVGRARAAGIRNDSICIDPGLGFAKTADHNWEILRRLFEFKSLGYPLVVGPSRKRFLGELLGGRPPGERDEATIAAAVAAAFAGADLVRVHAARGVCDALAVVSRLGLH
jgi:dihydropteroate synthase